MELRDNSNKPVLPYQKVSVSFNMIPTRAPWFYFGYEKVFTKAQSSFIQTHAYI